MKVDIYKTPKYYNEGPRKQVYYILDLDTNAAHSMPTCQKYIVNNFKWNCGASFEDAIHYFLECPLYLNERRTLLSNCDDIQGRIQDLKLGGTDFLRQKINFFPILGGARPWIRPWYQYQYWNFALWER